MLGLRLDEPLPLAGLEHVARRGRARAARSGSASPCRGDGTLALTRARPLPRRRRHRAPARLTRGRLTGGAYHGRMRAALPSGSGRLLRRVVEEYVATGPAGRVEDARRARRARRLAVDRAERARRARAARAAHASAHLGGARADRGRLPPLRRRAARARRSRGRPTFPLDLPAARAEVEEALQATTEMLSQVTRLLALVSAPPLEAATRPARRGAAAAAERRDGRRDHVDRRRHEAALRVPRAGRPGPRHLGGRLSERAARRRAPRLARCKLALRRAEPRRRASARSCSSIRGAFEQAPDDERRLYVGGAAGLLDDMRAEEIGAYRSLMEALEKRAALLDVLAQRLDPRRPFARVGDELEQSGLRELALVGATYGLAHQTLGAVSLLGPLRMDYEKALRSVRVGRARAVALRRRGLRRRRLMATTDRDYYELLGVARDADERDDQEGVPRGSRASCIPTSPTEPDAERALPRGDRGVRGALELRDARSSTTATATRACAPAASSRRTSTSAASATSSPRSSATTCSAAARGGARRAAPTSPPRSRSSWSRPRAARRSRSRSRSPSTCATCGGDGVEPGTTPLTLPALRRHRPAAAGLAQRLRRVRPHARLPGLRRPRRDRRAPVPDCDGAGRDARASASSRSTSRPGIHDGQRIRALRRGACGRARRPRGRRLRRSCTCEPDPRFVREGNDIFSQVDLTIVQAALGATVTVETLDGADRARVRARDAARRGARAARQGHAGAAGLRPRRPARARQRHRAAPPHRRAAPAARGVRAASDETRTGTTRASSTS